MQAPRAGAFWVDSRLPLTASRSYRPKSLNGPRAGPWLLIRTPLALIRSLGRAGTPWRRLALRGWMLTEGTRCRIFWAILRSIRAPACCLSTQKAAICFISLRRPKSTGTAPSCRRCGEWIRPCRWGGVQQKGLRSRSIRVNRLVPGREAPHLARRRFRL